MPLRACSCLLGAVLLGACHPAARPPTAGEMAGYPRCLAFDADGNEVACAASPRAYDGESCACANGRGRVFYGRVQEYPRP